MKGLKTLLGFEMKDPRSEYDAVKNLDAYGPPQENELKLAFLSFYRFIKTMADTPEEAYK